MVQCVRAQMDYTALLVTASFGGSWDLMKGNGASWALAAGATTDNKNDACAPLKDPSAVAGKVVVAVRSACSYSTKVRRRT